MPNGFLNRKRAETLMAEQGLDALVLAQPESIAYASGAFPGVATFWRRAGAAFLIVPRDATQPMTAIVGDLQAAAFKTQSEINDVRSHPIWVETGRLDDADLAGDDIASALVSRDIEAGRHPRTSRPAQFDLDHPLGLLRDVLAERHLLRTRIGLELGFIAVRDMPRFGALLPHVSWVDCTTIVERLRAIKHPREIAMLRTAAELAQAGMTTLLQSITPGMDAQRMTKIWRDAALAEAARRHIPAPPSTWAYIAVAGDGFAPGPPCRFGDLIKIDIGCVIDGYSSDGGRTAVMGEPSTAARQVFDALHRAFDLGLAKLKPGEPLREVYATVASSMWDQGFSTYNRGHFGHGVGASIWSEEWPFIAADATAEVEPGMVLAFETPYYIKGLGGFIIEDQLLVTATGIEVMAPSPRDLIRLQAG